jgi:hypothetical protein
MSNGGNGNDSDPIAAPGVGEEFDPFINLTGPAVDALGAQWGAARNPGEADSAYLARIAAAARVSWQWME